MPGRLDSKWDNMEIYKSKKDLWKTLTNPQDPNKRLGFILLNQIIGISKKKKTEAEEESTSPKEWVVVGCLVFGLILIWSKKGRKWTKDLLFMTMFAGGMFSIGSYVFKLFLLSRQSKIKSLNRGSQAALTGVSRHKKKYLETLIGTNGVAKSLFEKYLTKE